MKMPFGKYQNYDLRDIPADYLEWCLENLQRLSPGLRRAIRQALEDGEVFDDDDRWNRQEPPDWDAVLRSLHRELALEFHPDRGGSVREMQVVNIVIDRLRKVISCQV